MRSFFVPRELRCVNGFLGVALGSRNAPFISLFALPMLEPVVISHA
jgi:hypothetical protein